MHSLRGTERPTQHHQLKQFRTTAGADERQIGKMLDPHLLDLAYSFAGITFSPEVANGEPHLIDAMLNVLNEPSYCLLIHIEKVDNGPRSKEALGVADASRTPMQ